MKVYLVDGSFFPREQSATLAGENSGQGPQAFGWTAELTGGTTFYTDVCLAQAVGMPGRKVAWLLEPPWKLNAYQLARELRELFEYILTYRRANWFGNKQLFYPLGGSWLRDWGVFPKTRMCSLIASDKAATDGHLLRHQVARRYAARLDVLGRGYWPIESKAEGLRDYRYSIVIESWRGDWYFSEKLIDCLSQGTIPIYWGCPNIGRFFNPDGILSFETLQDLDAILTLINEADYLARLDAIRDNLERARQYLCVEDWIYEHYPFLFKE